MREMHSESKTRVESLYSDAGRINMPDAVVTTYGDGRGSHKDIRFSRFKYDVFLSFRGEDTRHIFTVPLFNALNEVNVRAFIDSERLKGGDEVSPKLIEAIHDSAFAIAVISRRYADSRWCLEELATLVKLKKLVMPVFYGVNPSDVMRQRGSFAEDFMRHENEEKDKVRRWRTAMENVGGTPGWDSKLWKDQELIKTIVKQVLKKLSNIPTMEVAEHPTGLGSRIKEMLSALDVNASGVKIVNLYGIAGVGKTTLAKAVYNKLFVHFRRHSFISNVRESWGQPDGKEILQKTLDDELLVSLPQNKSETHFQVWGTDSEDKVLVVLDDVDDIQQIHALATKRDILHTGSRLIITSRNKVNNMSEGVVVIKTFEVTMLNPQKSLQLFSYHAFGKKEPSKDYMKLSEEIVGLVGGLPLALEVFGSFLLDKRRMEDWNDALQKLKKISPCCLSDILTISFNALDREEQCIFLDIACFFVQVSSMKREDVVDALRGCGFAAEIALTVLVSKSLIKMINGDTICMHDSLREMGREIVRSENPEDPAKRSRIWDQEAMAILRSNKGTRSIQAIILECAKDICCRDIVTVKSESAILDTKAFGALSSLRLLNCNNLQLQGPFRYMPTEIKWLQWKGCPFKEFPDDLYTCGLDLSNSTITHLWSGHRSKMAEKLMFVNLSNCHHLTSIPDLSGYQMLEKLSLRNCIGLRNLHQSVGDLNSLVQLNLEDCSNLREFPTDVSGLMRLEKLNLAGCSRLKELPSNIASMSKLKQLNADRTALEKLPHSIYRLENLEILTLTDCLQLKKLPEGIRSLTSLEKLALSGAGVEELPGSFRHLVNLKKLKLDFCISLQEIPSSINNLTALESLHLGGQVFTELPSTIGSLSHLKVLSVVQCKQLNILPNSIGGLASLKVLNIGGTALRELPEQVGCLNMLDQLDMGGCDSLERLPSTFGYMNESILNITKLSLSGTKLTELPESIGMMERLHTLIMEDCKHLQRLPASFGNLKSLCYLTMTNTALTELLEEFGMLSSLKVCKMWKLSYSEEPANMVVNAEEEHKMEKLVMVPKFFSNLSSLKELDLNGWKISGKIPDELGQLKSLVTLKLARNNISHLPDDLRGLIILKYLFLSHCTQLMHLPHLPSSLIKLDVSSCTQLESISDLSNLEHLEDLNLAFCVRVSDIPGLHCLKSLKRLSHSESMVLI